MFDQTTARHDSQPRFWSLLAIALTPWQLLVNRATERKAYKDLSRFDDHLLKDIGISRGSIRFALREGRNRGQANFLASQP